MNAVVRRATPHDAEAIAEVHIRCWQVAYRGQLPDHYLDHLGNEIDGRITLWRSEISSPRTANNEVWVAGIETEVDGFVAIGPARDADSSVNGEVYAIYVSPNCWGHGLGRALFAQATSRIASLGYATAMLWVLESNTRARRFYEVAGWAVDGGSKRESNPAGIELREVSYRIRLNREQFNREGFNRVRFKQEKEE